MLEDINQAEKDQRIDYARIEAAINVGHEHLSAFPDCCPDEEDSEWSTVRERVNRLLRDVLRRAKAADEIRRRIVESFLRGDGSLSDRALISMVADIPTEALVDHLRYCLRTGDLGHARQLGVAFSAREDRDVYVPSFEKVIAEWLLSESGDDTLQKLINICRLGEQADAKIRTLLAKPGSQDERPAALPAEEISDPIVEKQEGGPNLAADQLTSAPAEILPAMDVLGSSIVVDASPTCSQPLDALLDALSGAPKPSP